MSIKEAIYINLYVDSNIIGSYSDLLKLAEEIYNIMQTLSVGIRIKYSWVSSANDYSNTNRSEFDFDITKERIIYELSWKLNYYDV